MPVTGAYVLLALLGVIDTERYLYSDCALLALAVSSLTGWPVVQITEGPDDDPIIRHVLVRMPDGRLLDAEGPHENYWGEVTFDRAAWEITDQWQAPDVLAAARELLSMLT